MNRATYRVAWIAFGIAALLGVTSMAAGAPLPQIPVLTTSSGEFQPARSENALAWEQNTRARPNQYNVMVQVDGSTPVQANRGGTSAAMGDFAGNQLVFQQYKGNPHIRGRSDLLFFDVSSGARTKVQGVNTRQWEYWPSHSDGWLLYGRWKPKKEVRRLFLHDLETGERRLLDKTKGANRFIGPGQVQGNYAVWSTCRSRCNVFRYDIAANTEQMIDNPGSFQRAPSVTPGGTVYFSRGGKGCGASVALVRSRLDGQQEVLVQLQQGLDIRDTYAYAEPNGTTEVYYERNACRTKAGSDIYKVRDMALVPLEVTIEGTGTGTVSSSPAGISCGADCSEDYEVGTEVTLTATANPGSVFVGWSGTCSGVGSCSVAMNVPHAVTATFLPLGSVTVVKDSLPNDPQVFQFDPDAALAPDFELVDNDVPTQSTKLISGVDPGTYEIREGLVPGWQLTDITCVGVSYTRELGNRRVTIQLEPNDAALCTFENTKNGQIRITKQTNPDGSGQSFAFTRSYGSNVTLTDGQTHESGFTLTPGTYSVQENIPAGWQLTGTACTDGSISGAISLSPGETVTCTFTNTQNGRIFVTKQTNPDGSGQSFTFTRSYGSGFVLSDGQTHDSGSTLSPGTYSVAENPVSGWDLISSTCSDGSAPGNINLSAGETVTCTFSNRQDGKILVTKQTTPDGSPQTFGFSTNYGPGFSLEDGQTNDSGFLDPGTYSVSENAVSGWTLTSSGCSDGSAAASISLSAGETVTCTFNNRQLGRILVTKQTLPDGSAQNFTFTRNYGSDFTLSDGQTNDSGFTLDPGTYSVSETVPNGWTLTDVSCSDDSAPGSISLAAGETVSCTFENTQEGSITIVENSVDDDPQVFGFSATGLTPNTFTLDDDGAGSNQQPFSGLAPGTYFVSEDADPAGWQLTDITCVGGGSNTTDTGRTATIGLDLGEDVTCTFTNTEEGSITVITDAQPNAAQDFGFTTTGGLSPSAFNLDDDADGTLSNTRAFADLLPGNYSVSEDADPPGWQLTDITCVGGGLDTSDTGRTAAIGLDPGENVVCTFTNTEQGTIVVAKETNPDGSAQSFQFQTDYGPDFLLADGGTNNSGDLAPETYSVAEVTPSGWTLTSVSCSDGSPPGAISVDPGETVTCTFTNTEEGSITIVKDAVNNSPQNFGFTTGGLSPASFSLDDDGVGQNQRTFTGLLPGTYSVSEDPDPAGWQLTDITCLNGGPDTTDTGRTATIGLDPGEDVVCTFTNTEEGSITVVLDAVPDDGQDFDYSAAALSPAAFTLDDDDTLILPSATPDTQLFPNVLPGTYSVVETIPLLWSLDSITCVDPDNGSSGNTGTFTATIDLDPGEDVTCTFTNSLLP